MPLPNILEFIGTNISQRKFQQAQEKLLNYLGIEVPTKTELNSVISNVNDAITPKADKVYVDNALASFQNGALKTYPTLAAANADIANILLNTKVSVLSATEGGDYYKATAGATSLTKSPHDPKNQAVAESKSYTDQQNELNLRPESSIPSSVLVAIVDERGARTFLEVGPEGAPTPFSAELIKKAINLNNFEVNSEYLFAVVDDLGRSTFLINKEGVVEGEKSKNSGVDLSTWTFFGSSSMYYLQDDVFNLLKENFKEIRTAKYYGVSASVMQHTLANIGVNKGSLVFTEGIIDNTARDVTTQGFDMGIPIFHAVVGTLENSISGKYQDLKFTADNEVNLSVNNVNINFISDGSKYRNAASLVNIGKNNVAFANADASILSNTREAVNYLDESNGGHTIVLGHFVNTDQTATGKANIISLNNSLRSIYFDRFIDTQAYLMSDQVWIDVGLTKTAADISAIADGVLPPSLGRDNAHLSDAIDTQLAKKILNLVILKGWYN